MNSVAESATASPRLGRDKAALTRLIEAELADAPRPIEVLEVGGGSISRIGVTDARFTVVEVDPASVEAGGYADEVIIGNAEGVDLSHRQFDLVVFFNVLEHLPDPRRALLNGLSALRPGKLLVIAGPEPRSLKAMITRWTPQELHVLFYRHVRKEASAGSPGHGPFPTHLSFDADPHALKRTMAEHDCPAIYEEHYVGPHVAELRDQSPLLHAVYRGLNAGLRLVTSGRRGAAATDFVLVFRKGKHLPRGISQKLNGST